MITATELLKRIGYGLIVVNALLGLAHILWPDLVWGDYRSSIFNFQNMTTLASWLASMQLLCVGGLALVVFHRLQRAGNKPSEGDVAFWLASSILTITLSFSEMSRIHRRLELLGYPNQDFWDHATVLLVSLTLLGFFGSSLLEQLRLTPDFRRFGVAWMVAWSIQIVLARLVDFIPDNSQVAFHLITGWAYLFGCTALLVAVGGYALQPDIQPQPAREAEQ